MAKNSSRATKAGAKPAKAAKRVAKTATRPARDDRSNDEADSKSRLSQTDVPSFSLDQALRVPRAIAENYAFKATKPMNVAAAMNMTPSSGQFRARCGAAIAYGLTSGGYNAPEIKIEPVGMRIVRPLEDGDDLRAKREALLKPRVFGEFLRKYDGAPLPREEIAKNVLLDMGVPIDRTADVLQMLLESAESVGFVRQIKDKRYVDLDGVAPSPALGSEEEELGDDGDHSDEPTAESGVDSRPTRSSQKQAPATRSEPRNGSHPAVEDVRVEREANSRRVFITHGKNKSFLDPIRKLLSFGEMQPVVSVDKQSVSVPVPDKVMGDMRSCGAAIIHVDAEQRLIDAEAKEHIVLNPNVLIEIGAAMALYGRRFILLVREGVQLPSNLQGLYEVRYKGDALDGDATIRLLEAINDIKNYPVPLRYAKEDVAGAGG